MEKKSDLHNVTIDIDNEILDNDMEKLLAILHNVPEVEIPDRFEKRFSEALKEEGSRIRKERLAIAANEKRKWYLKVAATAAACFVVVFASVSMYNDVIGPDRGVNPAEESADAPMSLSADMSNDNAALDASKGIDDAGSIRAKEELTLPVEQPVTAMGRVDAEGSRESDSNGQDAGQAEIYYGMQSSEADTLCREGSKYVAATEEYWMYRRLVDEYLAGYEYKVTDCERDSETGSYLFEVHILMDPEGQIVDEPMILRGEQGEIHDSEKSTEGDEPQTDSD